MSLIGQPESYSDILKRVFAATCSVAVLCTLGIAGNSPPIKSLLDSVDATAAFGIVEGLKALYLVVPMGIAIVARVFVLHDKISHALRIRKRFDTEEILRPLALGVGFPMHRSRWEALKSQRVLAMTRIFYPYASFSHPKIDLQLVRTAADRWGWFWSALEPQAVLLPTALIFLWLDAVASAIAAFCAMAGLAIICAALWPALCDGARRQTREILANATWRQDILAALNQLAPPPPAKS